MFDKSSLYYPSDNLLKKNLMEKYSINYIKSLKSQYNSVLIECATPQEARALEDKLKGDYIKTLKLEGVMVSVHHASNKNFTNLFLLGDTSYQEEAKKQQIAEEAETTRLAKFASSIATTAKYSK